MLINQANYTAAADDPAEALGELGSYLGPELAGEYTKATLKTYGIYGRAVGGVIPEAAMIVKSVRVGGNVVAQGISFVQCAESAGF